LVRNRRGIYFFILLKNLLDLSRPEIALQDLKIKLTEYKIFGLIIQIDHVSILLQI